jgi:hypothetical protein
VGTQKPGNIYRYRDVLERKKGILEREMTDNWKNWVSVK